VRGNWFCDSWTRGVPVKINDAPHRRKRVRFVYVVTVASSGVGATVSQNQMTPERKSHARAA
jgi:hypothetical protein